MAIYHDAYPFKLKDFVASVKPYIQILTEQKDGYNLMRSHALQILDKSDYVKKLCHEYGGWSQKNIQSDFPSDPPYSTDDIAFWIVVLLYAEFVPQETQQLGLGRYHSLMGKVLPLIGWEEDDIRLLIRGNSFVHLAKHDLTIDGDFWKYVRPFSVASWAGWMSLEDAQKLLLKLDRDEEKLSFLTSVNDSSLNIEEVEISYQAAKQMLGSAKEIDCDLCLVLSG